MSESSGERIEKPSKLKCKDLAHDVMADLYQYSSPPPYLPLSAGDKAPTDTPVANEELKDEGGKQVCDIHINHVMLSG